ncbi:hypothetical protein HJC23_009183 [Cyclotella cryptica]|uniref:ER membrane protein complex subunit 3 n=1 Tax=Cyclotella cryptica TaxID=29204 RepID=A0ABD3PKW3_9STRA|eukprot:CCRYP_013790-RA/>CCRYP_013790-RA protein AED:0.00 eAED:0.00 QI:369/-1/1/1/-1/1/1/160/330
MTSATPPIYRPPQATLLLDSQIRDWVVLPLLIIMIIAGLLRSNIGKYLRPPPKPVSRVDARGKSCLLRAARLRGGNGGYLSEARWEARRLAWSARSGEGSNNTAGWLRAEATRADVENKLQKKAESGDSPNQDIPGMPPGMGDPAAMMDGMKGNMAAMVQNMVMMQGISHFFRGFVLVKVPFPLTKGFKQMFQRGLDLTTLDTSYVSSVSWYFLVMFGLRAFFRLAMGDPLQEELEGIEIQKEMGCDYGAGPQPVGFDAPKVLKAEADNLELLTGRGRRFHVDEAERNLLGKRYPKKSKKRSSGGNGEDVLFGLPARGKQEGSRSKHKAS